MGAPEVCSRYEPFPLQPLTRHSHQPSHHHVVGKHAKTDTVTQKSSKGQKPTGETPSFWQVTVDLANADAVPVGHGHRYWPDAVDGWVALGAPVTWTDADTQALRAVIDQAR